MIDKFEKGSGSPKARRESYDSRLGRFEVDVVSELRSENVGTADRAFIMTESGNRYMVRHSKGRGEELVIYNERKGGFVAEAAHPFMVRNEGGKKGPIARIGQPLNVLTSNGEWRSTKVVKIEIRRGVEAAVRKAVVEQRGKDSSLFGGIAKAIGDQAGGARTSVEKDVDPLDPKYRRR